MCILLLIIVLLCGTAFGACVGMYATCNYIMLSRALVDLVLVVDILDLSLVQIEVQIIPEFETQT